MKQYIDYTNEILTSGNVMTNRTGTDTISTFGQQMRFDLSEGFPAMTTRKAFFKGAVVELCWMLKGLTNINYLKEHNVNFWDHWAIKGLHIDSEGKEVDDRYNSKGEKTCEIGDLGPVYGEMIRRFPNPDGSTTDQLAEVMKQLRVNPTSRRHIVDLWCPFYLPDESLSPQQNVANGKQALAPCHMLWVFKVDALTNRQRVDYLAKNRRKLKEANIHAVINAEMKVKGGLLTDAALDELLLRFVPKYRLNLHMHMRSSDAGAGAPINVMFYSILTELMSYQLGYAVGELWFTATDAHIYSDQVYLLKEQVSREPLGLSKLVIKQRKPQIWDYEPEDFELINYRSHEAIKMPVAV